jgi:hypothetical protein
MAGLEIKEKRELHLLRWLILVITIGSIALVGWYVYKWYTTGEEPPIPLPVALADSRIDESNISQSEIDSYTTAPNQPRYISIPKLKIDKTRIQKVGVTSTNQLDVPENINDTAWYEKSATPGQGYGAVLIDGHNGGITRNGVFDQLKTLQNGDEIIVERGDGKKYTYSVVENDSMSLEEATASGMKKLMKSAVEGQEGLSLTTSDGKWIPKIQQFERRIMLRAVINDE